MMKLFSTNKDKPSKKLIIAQLQAQVEALEQSLRENQATLEDQKQFIATLEKGYFEESTVSPSTFYDVVIDIPAIKDLAQDKGWKITFKKWEEYKQIIQKPATIVSIVGNFGKGKTFLLGLLNNQQTPAGFNSSTQGLSAIYLRDQAGTGLLRSVLVMDTKGESEPVQISHIAEQIDEMRAQARSVRDSQTLEAHDKLNNVEEIMFMQALRDHDATEDVLQNYIMEEANIILVVVADLSFHDQRLVKKILKKFRDNDNKKIIVVHNLFHAKTVAEVKQQLDSRIATSFNLTCSDFAYQSIGKNPHYFIQKGPKNCLVHHLIIAKDKTEAGAYYNDVAIKHIKDCIGANGYTKEIDVVKAFYAYLQGSLPRYVKTVPELQHDNIKLVMDGDIHAPSKIQIDYTLQKTMEIKAVIHNELGELRIFKDTTEFEPSYSLYEETESDTKRFLCLKVECPDACSDFGYFVNHTADEFSIQVKGKKEVFGDSRDKLLANTRDTGNFFVETEMYKKAKYRFDYDAFSDKPNIKWENGVMVVKWLLRPNAGRWIEIDTGKL